MNVIQTFFIGAALAGMKQRGLNQMELAREIEISTKHLSQILNGRQNGSLEVWERIFWRLGITWTFDVAD